MLVTEEKGGKGRIRRVKGSYMGTEDYTLGGELSIEYADIRL